MLRKYGRRIAVLLAVSLIATSLPAAAAVPEEKEEMVSRTVRESTPPEWEDSEWEESEWGDSDRENSDREDPDQETSGREEAETEPVISRTTEDETATDPEWPEKNAPDADNVPVDVTEWSFAGTAGIVKKTMEGTAGDCSGIYINATRGKAAPRDGGMAPDTQINSGTILYIPVAGTGQEQGLTGRQIVLHVQAGASVSFEAEVYGGTENGNRLEVVSGGNQVRTIDYDGEEDVYIKLTVGGSGSAYFTAIEVTEQRETPVGPEMTPEEFPTGVNFADSEMWPAEAITEAELIHGLYFDPAEGALQFRGSDLMGHGAVVYLPLKGGVEADVTFTVYEKTVLEAAGESFTAGAGWPAITILENYTAEEDEWLAVTLAGSQNYIRSISIRYAGPLEDPDGSVTEWLFDGSEQAFSGSLQGESDYYQHLFIDASEGKCEARPANGDTQVAAGTWIWVPVSGKGELVLTSFVNGDTVIEAGG